MDPEKFQAFLNKRYSPQLEFYSKASAKNQKLYKRYQLLLIILSALTPVCAALNKSYPEASLNMVVILLSSVVAILTTVLKTFNYHELWVTYRSTLEKLKPERNYYDFNIGVYGEAGTNKDMLFVTRVEAILGAEHTQWPPAKDLVSPKK